MLAKVLPTSPSRVYILVPLPSSWLLTKSTAIIAALFIISSISLVILSRGDLEEKQSVIERIEKEKDSDSPKIPESEK